MSIELKYRFKYHFTVLSLATLTLFLGVVGIFYGIEGFIMIPVISAFLAALVSVEKRRIASVIVSVLLLLIEVVIGFMSYFTIVSLSSILVAVIISAHYLKKRDKNDSVLFATIATAAMILLGAVIYIFSMTDVTSLGEAYDYFREQYELFKENTILTVISMAGESGASNKALTPEYMNEIFDAYLNCIVAIVSILAFFLVGLSHKIFSGLIRNYSRRQDDIDEWRFMPSAVFAYFYFALSILSLFSMDTESVLALSVANLYLIFMFVFAYIGFRFASAALNKNGRSTLRTSLAVLALTVLFSSFAVQILAAIGAFIAAYRSKFFKNHNLSDK